MGCGASNEAKGNDRAEDKKEEQQASQSKPAKDEPSQENENFDSGVAPTDKPADRSGADSPADADAPKDAGTDLNAFTFGEGGEESAFGGGFVAFGGGGSGGAFGEDHADEPDSPKPQAKPRRIAVSDECADADDTEWTAPVVEKSEEDKALIAAVLKRNPLLQNLDGADVDVVVNAMERKDFAAGARVLEQGGDGGTHYYVIAAGQVEIIKNNQLVCTFSEGQGFGEMELLYVQPVVATVRCRVDTKTWALDRKTYKKTVMRLALERRKLYSELLSNVDFLENMTEYERQTLADALSPVTLAPGESMIRRGEVNEWMYIIIEGTVEVLGAARPGTADAAAPDADAPLTHITDLERGSCVGELEFLNQHPAVADCIATTTVRACKLHRDHFELCMGPVTDVLRRTVRQDKYAYYQQQLQDIFDASAEGSTRAGASPSPTNSKRRRHRHAVSAEADGADDDADWTPPVVEKSPEALEQAQAAVRRCPLFSALSGQDSTVVVDALQPVSFPAGTRIIQEGAVPEEAYWYIISKGAVVLKQAGGDGEPEQELAVLTEGQSFGELDLMYSTPSVASAVALGAGDDGEAGIECFRLDRRTYRKIVMQVTVERRRLYRELLTGVPFLAQLTDPQQSSLADALSPCSFTSGELLCRHGHVNEWMFIVVDGVVEVFGADGNKVCDLRRGEMVGELEFFFKHKCVANCVAKTHVTTCRLHRDHFEACMGPVSGFVDEILKTEKYAYYKSAEKHSVA
mmetsp:Transcript_13777/g.42887  ORF Transcript_13777/g.42887 Transcript_13777/m.42887 type:complete len:747 (-) Transcript_13777:229-2469(-)|eukprot:CAMPEP_0174852526 /NCGR_PEP_ID=MMETSP1114-20130205/25698_1 /TAXON_ID=312471 /ORGANISM="Neobodo designis, Strain CCAP 1951/1" /LENGTH=746 /DNA_ID=CAMNT_0016087127 /DNA_START=36 /DNA_END=2276 /DNA_ORIENTATION=+